MALEQDQWRWTFEVTGKIMSEQAEEDKQEYMIQPKKCKIQIDVSKVDRKYFDDLTIADDEIIRAIEFTRMGGDSITFMERFKELKDLFKEIDNVPFPNFDKFNN